MKPIVWIYLLLFSCLDGFTQNSYNPTSNYRMPAQVSPEISSLMKYVDYPVNLYNGLVNIDIPLYTLIEGEIAIPISISYHASGIKVLDLDGRIGLGWTLNAEPILGRNITGIPDDGSGGYLSATSFGTGGSDEYYQEQIAKGIREMEPDAFYYKLLNKSGKFYFHRDLDSNTINPETKIVIHPYEPLKIDCGLQSGVDYCLDRFDIIDEDGYKYHFGVPQMGNHYCRTQWNIKEITSPSNDKVIFNYTPSILYQRTLLNDYVSVEERIQGSFTPDYFSPGYEGLVHDQKWPFISIYASQKWNSYNINLLGHTFESENPKLQEIEYISAPFHTLLKPDAYETQHLIRTMETETIKIEFEGDGKLSGIKIRDKTDNNKIIKSIKFYLSNYDTSSLQKLDKVTILDKDEKIIETYSFDYNTLYHDNKSTHIIDHWGYCNLDKRYNHYYTTPVPLREIKTVEEVGFIFKDVTLNMDCAEVLMPDNTKIVPLCHYPASREPDEEYMQSGILQSITYPTGRKSTFYYEAHQYLHETVLDENGTTNLEKKIAGGLRIHKIDEYDPLHKKTLTRIYKYGENENGIGHIKQQLSLDDYMYEHFIATPTYRVDDLKELMTGLTETKIKIYTSNPIPVLLFGSGSSVAYEHATEYVSDNLSSNGKTTYLFYHSQRSNHGMYKFLKASNLVFDYDDSWQNGHLLDKAEYKINGQNLIPVRRNIYDYFYWNRANIDVTKAFQNVVIRNLKNDLDIDRIIKPLLKNDYIYSQTVPIYSGCKRLASETSELYTDQGIVKETVTYKYNNENHMFPTEITKVNSNGRQDTIINTYPQDITFTDQEQENGRNKLIQNNQLRTLLQKKTITGNETWINKTKYTVDNTNGKSLPVSVIEGKLNKEVERIKILKYDTFCNPVHIQKDGGINKVYIWGYNGKHLIAEIQNATYTQVQSIVESVTKKAEPAGDDWLAIRGLQDTWKDMQVTSYKHNPILGLVETTDPSGITTYYSYNASGKLKEIYLMENGVKKILQFYDYHYQQ